MSESSRYIVGIDLGTTNTTLSFVDAAALDDADEHIPVQEFPIPQVTEPGAVEPRPTIPSMLYAAAGPELPADSLHLPWRREEKSVLGVLARDQGARNPARFIHSSKSWLCHGGVDRRERILPWRSEEADAKRSPQEVATAILAHLREAWDHQMARQDRGAELARQEITLCVPASFDAEARNLTVEAAEKAGLRGFHLLEEPQAAFYAWVEGRGRAWRKSVRVGDLVLVVDVGGGTTDFSLIAVTEEEGELALRRVAVGEHILLGGDNMDLALAFSLRAQLEAEGRKLDAMQMLALVQHCRAGKERLLADPDRDEHPIALLGRGSSLVGGTIRTALRRDLLDRVLLDGFFPRCAFEDRPKRAKRTGFAEAGLPYAQDAAVTRHLARFLGSQEGEGPVLPTAVLFNGGVFHAAALRQRVVDALGAWCEGAGKPAPRVLEGGDLDLAVSRGAAYLGVARRGRGVRIRGGSARSYYVGFELPMPAVPGVEPPVKLLCVVPHGMEEGTSRAISGEPYDLCMWKGEPVDFRFFSSTTRRKDQPGSVLDLNDEEFAEHSPLEATIGAPAADSDEGEAVDVDLESVLTDIGVLQLNVVERDNSERHRLEFNVRHGDDEDEALEEEPAGSFPGAQPPSPDGA